MQTAADYFAEKLPGLAIAPAAHAALASMPLDSTCGDSCRAAIDAGAAMLGHVRDAHGDFPKGDNFAQQVAAMVADICGVYICG
jgi:hypothetical protein